MTSRKRFGIVLSAVMVCALLGIWFYHRSGHRLKNMTELGEIAAGPEGATGSLWHGLYYCGHAEGEAWFANDYAAGITYYRVSQGWETTAPDMPFTRDREKWRKVDVDTRGNTVELKVR
jgi:hypothetical protein